MPTQSVNRRHTIVAGRALQGDLCGSLEKDWFDYRWASAWEAKHVVTRGNHEFHVVSNNADFTYELAARLADAALAGKTRVIDLSWNSIDHLGLENGG